jgi:uncharacterized membrane protein YfcA
MVYIQIALAALIAGALDTVAGFGGGLLLIPILVLVVGSRDAVLLAAVIPLGWNIPRMIAMREWINWRATWLFGLGIFPGAILGGYFLNAIDPNILRMAIGAVLVLFGAYYVLRLYVDLPPPRGLKPAMFPVAGFVTGVIGSLLGAGHGPLQTGALIAASMPPREIAATNGAVGLLTAVSRIIGYGVTGELHQGLLLWGLVGVAGAWGGCLIGLDLARRSKDSTLELVIGIVLVIAGIRMLF